MPTFRERYHEERRWLERCHIVNIYHTAKTLSEKNWQLKDTAHYFQISVGNASECCSLAEVSEKVKHCQSKNEALKVLREKNV